MGQKNILECGWMGGVGGGSGAQFEIWLTCYRGQSQRANDPGWNGERLLHWLYPWGVLEDPYPGEGGLLPREYTPGSIKL